ncbi:L-glutamate gamma-semialdehyde dehydrogenase [Cohnella sp. JJ-181]|uniref:L-glutamate gamma-semialdehyde dehydrogenase n=1 Tax=Cohnella rhizoplanae TaxID=2974897 RepID=UPI0022FF9C52|nr:L-glutamate gamma-semialdehyde dehydrogenase [Cohnella sp. JJ-181]CAI6053737.1 1-pyrroline-5-carboxylate dehydrogenase 1 [Cohnella sp. JJ-181]
MVEKLALQPFKNEPLTDFSVESNRLEMETALQEVKRQLGQTYPLLIGGKKVWTEQEIVSINPAETDHVVGTVSKASAELIEEAVQSAAATFETWRKVPVSERADCLLRGAALIRSRKHAFSAWLVFEAGKNWGEADADTAEAIDFLEFYAREMIRLEQTNDSRPLIKMEGELNRITYIPLGVGAIIPPWNFPLAILAGMTGAAIVGGNTVLLKPASATAVIAYKFVEVMEEAGLPPGVIQFVPGSGAEIGDTLTQHAKVRFINFTGSKEVGLRIQRLAAQTQEGQIWMKRVIAEMGGKDGIVVDETADLDQAAQAIVASAFGFQGQKCSAGSRAIIVASVYDQVLEKVVEWTGKLNVGLPEHNEAIGPVIDKNAYEKILAYIEAGKQEGRLLTGGKPAAGNGYFIEPTVIADVSPKARIMQEEIFGPVLGVTRAKDWQEAIEIYNDTEYGLTGSFFSSDQGRIAHALESMHCGNLYINRKCTGAFVGVHPFGGFNMSGTDSKAGGYDYMLLFTQAKLTSVRQ